MESNSARTKHRYCLQTPAHRRHREQHRSACIRAHRTLTYYNLTTTQCLGTGRRHGPACSSQGGHYSQANPQTTLQSALPLRAVAGPLNNHPKTATPSPSPGLCMHCMQPSNHASSLPCDPNQTPRKARNAHRHHARIMQTCHRRCHGRILVGKMTTTKATRPPRHRRHCNYDARPHPEQLQCYTVRARHHRIFSQPFCAPPTERLSKAQAGNAHRSFPPSS